MKKRLKPWRLISAKPSDKVVTRDGREVLKLQVVNDPKESLWATEVTIKDPNDKRKRLTYMVNHNGRRYLNIPTDDDILIEVAVPEKEASICERDCMPDVLKAVEAAKRGDMAGVRRKTGTCDNVYIGSNSDE